MAISGDDLMHVLVVDDLAINRVLTMSLLRTVGIEASAAASGVSALDSLSKERYHAILIDFFLGDMTGDELTQRIRELYGTRHRIVGLSGDDDAETRQRALDSGMDAFLCKPASVETLRSVLKPDGPTYAGCS
ncbi:MAG: response regulator [Spirochaetaceae bacterium]